MLVSSESFQMTRLSSNQHLLIIILFVSVLDFFPFTIFWLFFLLLSSFDLSTKATPQHPSLRTFAPKHRVQLCVICCVLIVISLRGEDQPLSQHGGRAPADAPCFLNVELIQEAARHGGWLVAA